MSNDLPDYMRGFTEDADWGFTPVDSKPQSEPTTADTDVSEVKAHVEMIRAQMSEIMQIVEEQKVNADVEMQDDVIQRFKAIEKIIIPFLYKLSQGDEAYIHWPNRGPIISAQIEKLLKLTRGE
jgi:hypothetical protein